MEYIEINTLIDITKTKALRPNQGTQLEIDQYKNFITLMQCIEIRSIVEYNSAPVVEKLDLKSLDFGAAYKGKQNVWSFKFRPDRSGVYTLDDNIIGLLFNDLHQVPVVKNLTETINIDKAIFDLKDIQFKNTSIRVLES